MFLATTLADYAGWKYWDDQSRVLSSGTVLFRGILWLAAGLLFGVLTWKGRRQPRSPRRILLRF
jgi:hypothetical protein